MRGPKHCGLGFHSHVRVQSEMFNCLASISIYHYGCLVGELCSSLRPFQEGSWDKIAAILGVRLLLGVVRPREAIVPLSTFGGQEKWSYTLGPTRRGGTNSDAW